MPFETKAMLFCDTCGHTHDIPKLTADLIGMSCPSCSASMLTWKEFLLVRWAEVRMTLMFWLGLRQTAEIGPGGKLTFPRGNE